MTCKQLLKSIKLTDNDLSEIKNAVSKAEQKTTGEIAVALTAESSDYNFWELLASIFLSTLFFVVLLPFSREILQFSEKVLWAVPFWFLPAFFGLTSLLLTVIFFGILNIPAIDRLIVPFEIRKNCVTNRAFRHFAESGVYDTKEHSGILIFVSYMEKQVRIIADSGIASKIPQDLWNIIADELCEGIKKGHTKDGFVNAIEKCGELLSENFPNHEENPNELADGLFILEN